MNRLDQLNQFLKEDPNDPFTIYAIATEYVKIDLEEARKYFEILLNDHPNYIATYYHAGKLYEELEEYDLAQETYQTGIEKAKSQDEQLALRELGSALDELLMA